MPRPGRQAVFSRSVFRPIKGDGLDEADTLDLNRGPRLTTRRWLALDGLRGVAILLVVAAHAYVIPAVVGGMVGVTLFFVLSGFLITNLLIEEMESHGRLDLKAFYGRRALRLLPALGVYLFGISLVLATRNVDVPIIESAWPPALYVANYAQILGMDLFAHRHTWSLAVEEHFYLLWPVLVGLGATRRLRLLATFVGALVLWRFVTGIIDPMWSYMGTDTNAYALGIGALLAAVRRDSGLAKPARYVAPLSVAGLVLLALVQVPDLESLYEVSIWIPVLAAGLSAAAVWASVEGGGDSFLKGRTLRWFGLISYSLYLWHAPLMQIPGFGDTRATRLGAAALSVFIAWLSWTLIEGPILRSRLRRRFKAQTPLPAVTLQVRQ